MEKLSVWFCGLYTTPCLTGLLYGYDTVSISEAIDFLQDKYALSPALQEVDGSRNGHGVITVEQTG